jgi:hypothetical protein
MVENANVIEFLDEFQCLVDDAIIVDFETPKCQLVVLLLKTFPSSWCVFILHKEIKST